MVPKTKKLKLLRKKIVRRFSRVSCAFNGFPTLYNLSCFSLYHFFTDTIEAAQQGPVKINYNDHFPFRCYHLYPNIKISRAKGVMQIVE